VPLHARLLMVEAQVSRRVFKGKMLSGGTLTGKLWHEYGQA
jgi:hypothetical protein